MKKYIDENYIIITADSVVKKIKDICPNARVISLSPKTEFIEDELGINKYLIDKYIMGYKFVKRLKSNPNNVIIEWRATNSAIEKLSIELQSDFEEPRIAYKPINEWEQAFNTLKNASDNSELNLSDTEIGNLVYHLGKTGVIGVDLSSTKDFSVFYGMDGLQHVIEND